MVGDKMFFLLLAVAYSSTFLEELGTGSSCSDVGVVFINSYTVTPYPPASCVPQAIQMIGTFSQNYCVDQILVTEVYNNQQTFNQQVPIDKCFNKGEQVVFNFQINTFVCSAGTYSVQTAIQTHPPAVSLGCWQYSYTLS